MNRLRLAGVVGLVAAAALVLGGSPVRAQQKTEEKTGAKAGTPQHDMHAAHFQECAKACTQCMRACESCTLHCAKLIAAGKKEHLATMGSCMDCSAVCDAAARIVAHHGPMSRLICEGCARACDMCGTRCEKFSDDQHMQQCAKACRDCAQACREMIQHLGAGQAARTEKKTP